MPTPKAGYWLGGKRLPSVTTALWAYNPDGVEGLINWAVNLALGDREPIKNHNDERDKAAEIGTLAHAAVEAWAKGETFGGFLVADPEIAEPAQKAYEAFVAWMENSKFQITHTEVRLTSTLYGYGGTLDAAGLTGNGLRALLDWKTSNYIKGTMLWQGAAYKQLWDENFPDDPIVGGFHLLRFDKTTGKFRHEWFPDLDNEFAGFMHLKGAYDCYKITKRKLG